jgi:hypothetical protein
VLAQARSRLGAFRVALTRSPAQRDASARRLCIALFCISLIALALVPSASADPADIYARNYQAQITGFGNAAGISIDPAGHPWIVDSDEHLSTLVTEYAPFPSLTRIAEQGGQGHFRQSGSGYTNAAIDGVNGDLYVANTGAGANIQVFDPTNFLEEWTLPGGEGNTGWLSIDNSGGPSNGRIYVATFNPAKIQAFEPGQVPASFTCGAPCSSYIEGNVITGTPNGPFGNLYDIEVDEHGNIFVMDGGGSGPIQEFKPSGEFIREINAQGLGIALDPTNDHLLVYGGQSTITEYSATGEVLGHLHEGAPGEEILGSGAFAGMAVNSAGDLYVASGGAVDIFSPVFLLPTITYQPVSNPARNSVTLNATVEPNGGGDITACHFEYGTDTSYSLGSVPCTPDPAANPPGSNFTGPTAVHADISGLTTETTYHYRLVASNAKVTQHGEDQTYTPPPAVTNASTNPPTDTANVSATFNGSYTAEEGVETEYWFEYGTTTNYGHKTPIGSVPGTGSGAGTKTEAVSTQVEGLVPGTFYHLRLVARNQYGTTKANDETFTTDQPPTINASSTSNVTANSADLHAQIDPHGFATTYRFEYGTTSAYDQSAPVPDGEIAEELGTAHSIEVHLSALQGVQYHFRIVAENQWGTVASEDQTFEFFPPGCPNSAVRQQTGSAYLPDCRAYELVSPGNANGTLLYSGGPNTGEATSPSRFSFTGNANSLKGTKTIETAADLYTATRTDSGWESKYIGLPGDQAGCMGGPPNSPTSHVAFQSPPYLTNTVLTDPSMSRLLIWLDGTPMNCFLGRSPFIDNNWEKASPSNAPYMFNADGSINQRLPTSFAGGEEAVEALKCPYPSFDYVTPPCTGDVNASADLSHFVFSSNKASFAEEEGLEEAPGSAYDNDIATNTVSLISLDSTGHPIAQDPSFANVPPEEHGFSNSISAPGGKEEFIRFPAISTDGSHILMSTATARTQYCTRPQSAPTPCERFTDTPIHLYMRVNDAISYEPSRGEDGVNHAVKFLGMTPDGSKVFFTSEEALIAEDKDTSADLYMWSEATDSLTLVSKADNAGNAGEAGQSDSCSASWTTKCGVQPNENYEWSLLPGGEGGNGIADSAITPGGDIYFYSPEQLDGDRGIVGGQNLYDYREGKARFVATLEPEQKCRLADLGSATLCAEGPIVRFEVTPDDSRAAFLTTTQLTSYDNAGEIEMYSFTPSSGEIVCDSCRPDGKAPIDDVKASQDGRFLTNDGRVFFSTTDSLVSQDTNEGIDVYEFVDGRPQLITPGTGTATAAGGALNISGFAEKPGLVGVSNDGTDVYFGTFDTLTAEDHNGNFLKFYDARVNGGFAQPTPVPPCTAAEECHGAGSSAPQLPTQGTAAGISGGNAKHKAAAKKKQKKHKKTAKRHRARAAKSKGRAGK